MQVLYPRCCGLDVHKASLAACILVYNDSGEPEVRRRTFTTFTKDLVRLKIWLTSSKVTRVALESTDVHWKPVWNILERGPFQLRLVNPPAFPHHTGAQDGSQRQPLAGRLLRPSFVPRQPIRELRDLTRYRVHLKPDATASTRCWRTPTSNWTAWPPIFWASVDDALSTVSWKIGTVHNFWPTGLAVACARNCPVCDWRSKDGSPIITG